ncbi:(4Fe-4S)-binding protein [Ancylomarina longa]|uniref:Iron-binding zinc finger CDGSH type domain-containing protein n=1 Tax=Ancylomarina longa TaxID=2487017 RepID=A0A434AVS8_9BACT|nr:(4Fe-4S)-binding protein [Ancylomarina longa]RUT78579.1 hypothetical protein DLK05_06990 [Ancylomarina longa]
MKSIKKEYSNGEVTVVYEPDLCIHSGVCFKGLPQVFQPGTRPWVKMQGGSTQEIINQISRCPSRALSFYMNSPEKTEEEKGPTKALETGRKVEVLENGPLMVEGPITLVRANGKREAMEEVCYFCRCGSSKNKPFCDGSHEELGFKE